MSRSRWRQWSRGRKRKAEKMIREKNDYERGRLGNWWSRTEKQEIETGGNCKS